MGMKCGLPFAGNSINPSARGPLYGFDPYGVCASNVAPHTIASRMTYPAALRYKLDRKGELPMQVNDKAPEFTLPDQDGKDVSLKDFLGKTVVLFFYPKADTPG